MYNHPLATEKNNNNEINIKYVPNNDAYAAYTHGEYFNIKNHKFILKSTLNYYYYCRLKCEGPDDDAYQLSSVE